MTEAHPRHLRYVLALRRIRDSTQLVLDAHLDDTLRPSLERPMVIGCLIEAIQYFYDVLDEFPEEPQTERIQQ